MTPKERALEFLLRGEADPNAYNYSDLNALVAMIRAVVEQDAKIADGWAQSKSCDQHDDNPCCHIRTGAGIADAIRKNGLKKGK